MSEWQIEMLENLVTTPITYGVVKPGNFLDNGIKLIRGGDVYKGKISQSLRTITPELSGQYQRTILEGGELIVSLVGNPGQVAIVPKELAGANLARQVGLVRLKNNIHADFVLYYLMSPQGVGQLSSKIMGSVQEVINLADLRKVEIRLPPLEEQKAIASVLSSLDDKIDLLHRQNTTLEVMAETLFRQWFVEEAQEDWAEISFGKFVMPKKGKNLTKADAVEGIYPVIAGGLTPSCFHNQANTNAPVITISASGANAGFICLHHTKVWSSDSSYIDDSITKYVYFCYVFLKYNQVILTDKQEGSAQPHIYPSHIMDLETLNYPIELIESFENQIKCTFEKIKFNKQQIQTLEKLRDNLLPKLMSGEVRIQNA